MSLPVLTHYSKTLLGQLHSREQSSNPARKPKGLWLSVDQDCDGWRAWCHANNQYIDTLAVRHVVELKPEAKILVLDGDDAIELFTHRYGADLEMTDYEPAGFNEIMMDEFRNVSAELEGVDLMGNWRINWAAVAEDYQGILIPYFSREHHLFGVASGWYYGWDCASGCVWDADAIADVSVPFEIGTVQIWSTESSLVPVMREVAA